MSDQLTEQLKEIAKPVVEQEDMFLVDVEVKPASTKEIWILVDSESGGVNVDTCSRISRELAFLLEEENLINSAYRLNVSSPGLARPLSDSRQYLKNSGRRVKVKYKSGDDYLTVEGELTHVVNGTSFDVIADDGSHIKIGFSDVVETKVIPKI
ncbi:ribosome maturation factor RimP [Rhodohalobacter mucosus]|uniref:Ribosome maturation factor RimP n=1 Tax=Rhodohalobacter mucosus TaxID=2079485 RepID=A0A316TPM0_9BACT|nr:ribosome maturation factor [Rhodohalobacter mucosus]PWN06573.1 ribosome maturation factor [Rhodohalobacter mucosus]